MYKNFLVGPTPEYLIGVGSMLSVCMRDDTETLSEAAKIREQECGIINPCESQNLTIGYGK